MVVHTAPRISQSALLVVKMRQVCTGSSTILIPILACRSRRSIRPVGVRVKDLTPRFGMIGHIALFDFCHVGQFGFELFETGLRCIGELLSLA